MPFLNVTGITNIQTTFNVAFGVANKEDEDAYQWLIQMLDELREEAGARRPIVTITDFERALKTALSNV
jgi:hypothetical protein